MTSAALVNDRTLYQAGAGVSVTLRMLLKHWPQAAQCTLIGFYTRTVKRKKVWPPAVTENVDLPASYDHIRFALAPLARIRPRRRLPSPVRQSVQFIYDKAFRLAARRDTVTAVWEPNHLAVPSGKPTLATMHDLSLIEHPEWHPKDRVRIWEKQIARSISATTHWITDSRFSCDRMITVLGIPSRQITVVPLAPRALPYPPRELAAKVAQSSGLPERYFVALGSIEPRKNLITLLDAWAKLSPLVRLHNRLVFAGSPGWGDSAFWTSLANHPVAGEVLTTGHLDDVRTAVILACAQALLMPSHYEGFGLPLVEAMACGTPTLASDIPVFQEVCGKGSTLLPIEDAGAWANGIEHISLNRKAAATLSATGRQHVAQFSWSRSAAYYDAALARVAAV